MASELAPRDVRKGESPERASVRGRRVAPRTVSVAAGRGKIGLGLAVKINFIYTCGPFKPNRFYRAMPAHMPGVRPRHDLLDRAGPA